MASYDDELDTIRRDASTARNLREGQPGQAIYDQQARIRLAGGDPALGERLRAAQPENNSELRGRLTANNPPANALAIQRNTAPLALAAPEPAPSPIRAAAQPVLGKTGPTLYGAPDGTVYPDAPQKITPQLAAPPAPNPDAATVDSKGNVRMPGSAVPPRNVPLNATPMPPVGNMATSGHGPAETLSKEAQAFMAQRAAAAPAAVAPVAPAATQGLPYRAGQVVGGAIKAVADSKIVRGAGPAAIAYQGLNSGMDVAQVAMDPNKSREDVVTQAGYGAAKLGGSVAGAALGAQGGAALGAMTGPLAPVAVPTLGLVGAAAGAYMGSEGMEQGINKLRSMFGLTPKQPVETARAMPMITSDRVTLTPEAQRRVDSGETKRAVAPPVQQPANARPTTVAPASPRVGGSIAGAAQSDPAYALGSNAVEVIHPGGESYVQLFGADGSRTAVPSNVFARGDGAIAQYGRSVAEAQRRALEDPKGELAKQELENSGRLAQQKEVSRGALEVANVRQEPKVVPPGPIKDLTGTVTGYSPAFSQAPDGSWHAQPVQGLPKPKPTQDSINKLKKNAKDPVALKAFETEFGIDPMTYLRK